MTGLHDRIIFISYVVCTSAYSELVVKAAPSFGVTLGTLVYPFQLIVKSYAAVNVFGY